MKSGRSDDSATPGPLPPAKRAKTRSSPRACISGSDLGPELVGRISTFTDIGSDLMSLCVVAGPEVSTIIRKTFLRNNEDYLRYICARSIVADDDFDRALALKVRSWMEVNTDWKKRTSSGTGVKLLSTVTVRPTLARNMRFKTSLGQSIVYAGGEPMGVDLGIEKGAVLVKIGDERVGLELVSVEDITTLIDASSEEDDTVRFRFITDQNCIFSDPRFAIRFGLTEVLKVLVEEKGLGVNDRLEVLSGIHGANTKMVSLLWMSLMGSPDKSVFRYLLSRNDIDCCMACDSSREGTTIIHVATISSRVDVESFKAILQHPSADANVTGAGGWGALKLFCVLMTDKAKLKILLEAGADPHLQGNDGISSIDYLRFRLVASAQPAEQNRVLEMLALVEDAVSSAEN